MRTQFRGRLSLSNFFHRVPVVHNIRAEVFRDNPKVILEHVRVFTRTIRVYYNYVFL